jgi:hypothetical protein
VIFVARRRPLLRAAVVGGGAYMAGRAVSQNQAQRQAMDADQEARISQLEQQQYAQPAQAAPMPQATAPQQGGPSMLEQLNQLTALKDKGALTDEEFAAAKAQLLG